MITYSSNAAGEVRLFQPDGTSTTFYAALELIKIETTDPDGKKKQIFKDKDGKVILSRDQLDENVEGKFFPWLETYYIYHKSGALKYMISPKGVATLQASANWAVDGQSISIAAIHDQYCYDFVYDKLARLVEKKVPGQGWIYMGYDRFDRLVLMKDANTPTNKWVFIKYDHKGRPVMQGMYTNTTYTTRADVQLNVLDPLYALTTDLYYEDRGTTQEGYTNQSFPTTSTEVLTVNYYDNYDFNNDGTADYSYVSQGLTDEGTPWNANGLPTGSKRLILGTTTWLYSYAFYDVYGHVIQLRTNNHLNPSSINNLTTVVYDFEGKVKTKKVFHDAGVFGSTSRTATIINKFEYDHMGRLLKVYQNNNAAPSDQLVAQYEYNALGQLVDKKLHNTTGTSFLQSVDLRYSIQGWLTSINNSQLTNDGVINDEADDYFGMQFLYEKTTSGLTSTAAYNGNISAVLWKGAGTASGIADQKSYVFTYDKMDRLKTSTFQMNTGSAWTKEANNLNENVTYDHNGNILSLTRNKRKHQFVGTTASYISQTMDNLTYGYNAMTGNQLITVEDAAADADGFNNGSTSATEYTYSADGSLKSDLNKGISNIDYNFLGKPTLVTFTSTQKIEYVYDAGGTKLTMKTYAAGGSTPSLTTNYIDGFVYENDTLRFFASPEGRVVANKNGTLEYQYAIADLQGNTRVIFSSVNPTQAPSIATFENAVADGQVFKNVNTSTTYWVSKSMANNTPGGQYVMRMNNTYTTGPAKSLNVFPGDVLNFEVYTYFEGTSGFGGSNQPLTSLITSVVSALTIGVQAPEAAKISTGVNDAYSLLTRPGNKGDGTPTAYLNYIYLDRDYKLIDMGWTVVPAAANMAKQKITLTPPTVKEPGYMYVYLSYEGQGSNWVYFDDFKITHTKTNVIQYN